MAPRRSKDVLRSIQDSFRFENFEIYKNIEKHDDDTDDNAHKDESYTAAGAAPGASKSFGPFFFFSGLDPGTRKSLHSRLQR